MTRKKPQNPLRKAVALLLALCVLTGSGMAAAYENDSYYSIEVSAEPETIDSGTVDPVIYVSVNPDLLPGAENYIHVEPGTTGLSVDTIKANGDRFEVFMRGTAQEGVIMLFMGGGAFMEGSNETFRLSVQVLPSKGDDPIAVHAEPETIDSGTVDPIIYVTASEVFNFVQTVATKSAEYMSKYVRVDTGTTGLTLAGVQIVGETRLAVLLRGTAHEGTITIVLDGGAFLKECDDIFKLTVQVLPSSTHDYMLIFSANNGTNQLVYANASPHVTYALPECMFGAPEGQKFVAWSINGHQYRPGDPYTFEYNTVVEAIWDTEKTDHSDEVDYEERIQDALDLIEEYVSKMTDEEKDDPTAIDLATLYAETVIADAISIEVNEHPILISKASVSTLADLTDAAIKRAEDTLVQGGVTPHRDLSAAVTMDTQDTDIEIQVSPDLLESGADKVRVKTPYYALTFKAADLGVDLADSLIFKAALVDAETLAAVSAVDIEMSGGSTSNSINVSLPTVSNKDTTYQAIIDHSTDAAVPSKYNPVTDVVEGKVNTSGTYKVEVNEVDFTDIANKGAEMKSAIKYLASHGISMGTSATTFSPDDTISREQLTTLVVRALGKVDSKATTKFTDVVKGSAYYTPVASSQKLGFINGFEDNTFRGRIAINKEQIVVITARVLDSEMKYKIPSNTATYLSKYSDTVAAWAQPQVALATRENLVVYRTDGTFSGAKDMTRGDAAIIIYRLFQRLW